MAHLVYPVYGGDDMPYEPSYLRMVFESREDAIKYIKELSIIFNHRESIIKNGL